jgi:hypothetical protein
LGIEFAIFSALAIDCLILSLNASNVFIGINLYAC